MFTVCIVYFNAMFVYSDSKRVNAACTVYYNAIIVVSIICECPRYSFTEIDGVGGR